MKGSSRCHPKISHFGILILLSCRHLENSKCGERLSLNFSYLPKGRYSKRNSIVINPFPGSFNNWILLQKRHHTKTNFVTNYYTHINISYINDNMSFFQGIIHLSSCHSFKGSFIYLKNHLLSSKGPKSPAPFPIKMVFNPEF